MKTLFTSAVLGLILSATAQAKDDPVLIHGEKLHNEKCTTCHDTSVYTRQDRRVKTMAALDAQVKFCMTGAAKAQWTLSETNSVIEYLNTKFYRF